MAQFIKKGAEGQDDVFLEVPEGGKAPSGFVDASTLFSGTTGQETATIRREDTGLVTPIETPKDILAQAGGVSSSDLTTDIEDIRTRETSRLDELRGIIGGQFGGAIERRREAGVAEVGGTEARLGISRGLGFSSSRGAFVQQQRESIQKDIVDLEKAKAIALTNADFQAADREEGRIQQLRDNQFKLQQQAFENTLALLKIQPSAATQKPFTVAPGASVFDPETNEFVGTAPPKPSEAEPLTRLVGKNLLQFNQETEQWETVFSAEELADDELDRLLTQTELKDFNKPAGTRLRDIIGEIPKTKLTGVQKFQQEIKLGKEFEKLVGEARKASRQIGVIKTAFTEAQKQATSGKSINAASQGVLVAFQKLLDPTSVVRESEYARSGQGLSLWERIKGSWTKVKQGGAGLTAEGLTEFVTLAGEFLKGYEQDALKHAFRIKRIADRQDLDLESIITKDFIELMQGDELRTQTEDLGFTDDEDNPLTFEEVLQQVGGEENLRKILESQAPTEPFNQALDTAQKGLLGLGEITGVGSDFWKHGLDIDLKIGDSVPSPVSGKIVFADINGGFGNQVRILTSQGNEVWLSHLDAFDVQVGDTITAGQPIGTGGNTGNVIPFEGGDGSHLDVTVVDSNGQFISPQDILNKLKKV